MSVVMWDGKPGVWEPKSGRIVVTEIAVVTAIGDGICFDLPIIYYAFGFYFRWLLFRRLYL